MVRVWAGGRWAWGGHPRGGGVDRMEHRSTDYVPESLVAACAATAIMLVYSAPTPGTGSRYLDGRVAGYLAPLARGALRGEPSARVLAGLGYDEIAPFARALEVAGGEEALAGALSYALGAGKKTTLRDAMRFFAARPPLAREYPRDF